MFLRGLTKCHLRDATLETEPEAWFVFLVSGAFQSTFGFTIQSILSHFRFGKESPWHCHLTKLLTHSL